jgi:hypothetical protein
MNSARPTRLREQIKHLNRQGGVRLAPQLTTILSPCRKAFASTIERPAVDAARLITDSKQPKELHSIVPLTG